MAKHRFDILVSVICLVMLGYFGWHAFEGPRSFGHRDGLFARADHLEGDLAKLKTAQDLLESRVQLMRPESIDPDMLDELARRTLQYVGPDDLIIADQP
jgi:cell division protein FtsB